MTENTSKKVSPTDIPTVVDQKNISNPFDYVIDVNTGKSWSELHIPHN